MTVLKKYERESQKLLWLSTASLVSLATLVVIQFYAQSVLELERLPPPNYALIYQKEPTATSIPKADTPTPDEPTGGPPPDTPESAPLPVASATKPTWWIRSADGGQREFGLITAILPAGFTHQGGASVFGDAISRAEGLILPDGLIVGTLFAFGIWPTTDQTDYQKPIEFRITLDAAQVSGIEDQLAVLMYNPGINQWVEVSAQFRPESYQIVAQIESFTPVAKDFLAWGGRTFIGVFNRNASGPTQPPTIVSPRQTGPVCNRTANLRAGPGVNYPIVGRADAGQPLVPVAKLADGSWYLLEDGRWIAAFLVDNAPTLPNVESTPPPPTPTITPTPSKTPTSSTTPTPSETPTPSRTPTVSSTPTPSETLTPSRMPTSLNTPTPSRTLMPSGTPTPSRRPTLVSISKPPAIHRIDLLTVSDRVVIDLDEGGLDEYDVADMLIQTVTAERTLLIPINGAQLATVMGVQADFDLCTKASLATSVLEIIASPSEMGLCIRTKQNRFVHLRVLPRDNPGTQDFSLVYTTWAGAVTTPIPTTSIPATYTPTGTPSATSTIIPTQATQVATATMATATPGSP